CGHSGLGAHWYQKHAIMWAKRGYACFIFETIKQSENPGFHHGLYTGRRLDWISLGYTAAGGELLNSIRALDVLCEMPEVDKNRIGATGISGGGAHSHFLAIADERIKAVATSCGISLLKFAIGFRTMFQHCDCMYANGNFQRDICEFSALIAPRPLLYCFASEDNLFFKEEYHTLYQKVKKIYRLYGCEEKCELFEYPGPHAYSDASVKKINEWFDKYVAQEKHTEIGLDSETISEPEISVFNGKPPEPDRLHILPELLSIKKSYPLPKDKNQWNSIRKQMVENLKKNVFHWLDRSNEKMEIKKIGQWINENNIFSRYMAESAGMQSYIEVFADKNPAKITIIVLGDYQHNTQTILTKTGLITERFNLVLFEPRACGRNAADIEQGNYCLYRAGVMTGITPVLMWMNDLKYVVEFFKNTDEFAKTKLVLFGTGETVGTCLYYSIFDESISAVILNNAPDTHAAGCYIPGILKEIDITEASGLMAPRVFAVRNAKMDRWISQMHWGIRVYDRLGIREKYIMVENTSIAIQKVLSEISG
ncbi:MAG: alpha/beta hydrolase family protein, partial [Candidatus Ratteibacteria bacterium]